jgi:hypothetical protein
MNYTVKINYFEKFYEPGKKMTFTESSSAVLLKAGG